MTNYNRLGIKEATKEEMNIFNMVEEYMSTLPDNEADWLTEIIGEFVFSVSLDRKTCYNRLFRYIKDNNLNFTPSNLETWYCID